MFNFLSDETLTYLSVFFNINNSLLHAEYVAILLAFIVVTLSYLLAVQNPETEKLSPYEYGFEPYEDARNTFEIKFYLVAIIVYYF